MTNKAKTERRRGEEREPAYVRQKRKTSFWFNIERLCYVQEHGKILQQERRVGIIEKCWSSDWLSRAEVHLILNVTLCKQRTIRLAACRVYGKLEAWMLMPITTQLTGQLIMHLKSTMCASGDTSSLFQVDSFKTRFAKWINWRFKNSIKASRALKCFFSLNWKEWRCCDFTSAGAFSTGIRRKKGKVCLLLDVLLHLTMALRLYMKIKGPRMWLICLLKISHKLHNSTLTLSIYLRSSLKNSLVQIIQMNCSEIDNLIFN